MSGTGKSTFIYKLFVNAQYSHKFFFDSQGDFALRSGREAAYDEQGLLRGLQSGWLVFDPSEMFEGDLPSGFDFFCEYCFRQSKNLAGTKLFGCDDVQDFVTTNRISPQLALIVETARKWQIDFATIAQAPNLIHNRLKNQFTEVVCFRQGDDPDILAYHTDKGFNPEEIQQLPDGAFIQWERATNKFYRGKVF
jgi:hypothetical protein